MNFHRSYFRTRTLHIASFITFIIIFLKFLSTRLWVRYYDCHCNNSVALCRRSSHAYYCHNTCGKSHASSAQIRSTQRHDFRHDTSDTIVETRAQRVHRSQTGNNFHAGETGDNLQDEIPAIAAPPQPIMAAVPPADPAPPAPTFALGLGRDNTVLDWLIPTDTKLYYKAIAALDNKFDGTPEKFIAFLASVTS